MTLIDDSRVIEGTTAVRVGIDTIQLDGDLGLPPAPRGVVLFAHGSGSSRKSPRNRLVARTLRRRGFSTLLLDLLTPREEQEDLETARWRFDINLLSSRLTHAVTWVQAHPETRDLPVGLFGASTGAAVALVVAANHPEQVAAVVSRGGRPDLAGDALDRVRAPTLLIVGERDEHVMELNEEAMGRLVHASARLEIVPGATHLFEEPGTLERVAQLAGDWFARRLTSDMEPARSHEKDVTGSGRHAEGSF